MQYTELNGSAIL